MMPATEPNPSPSRPHEERVLRVRVTGFPRRAFAALCDLALLFAFTLAVTATVAMALHVPVPGLREIGPDLLVAGILDRNPMAVGAIGLLLGMAGLYKLYFAGIAGQTLGMRLVKKTVNQDDVSAYHLFYADKNATPGSDLTFFDWPVGRERRGTRSVIRTGLRVSGEASLAWWAERLKTGKVTTQPIGEQDGREFIAADRWRLQHLGRLRRWPCAAAFGDVTGKVDRLGNGIGRFSRRRAADGAALRHPAPAAAQFADLRGYSPVGNSRSLRGAGSGAHQGARK